MTDDYSTLQVEKHLSKETVFVLLFYISQSQQGLKKEQNSYSKMGVKRPLACN